ncbi:hypothetical protein D3248_07490 [Leucobacter zeae]|nr:hypothetical protein [Leucobacter zeae]
MLRATIRLDEQLQVDVEGESLESIHEQLLAARPEGFDLTLAPVAMAKASTLISATGTFVRRDTTREIEAESMEALRAQVPEGWRLLHVIRDR